MLAAHCTLYTGLEISNVGFGYSNLKSKGTWSIDNVRNISNVDFLFLIISEGYGIMVILGILVMLALESLISKATALESIT